MSKILFLKNSQDYRRIEKKFSSAGAGMRRHYDERFSNPLKTHSGRFCWDYWNVPGQYRHLRTPADQFFPKSLYLSFLNELLTWGRNTLGCQMISQPWLSAYVDGCHQALHSDVPHGPWAFVYSLTPWNRRKFTGGETVIARPRLLQYFQDFDSTESHETNDFFDKISPEMNQLLVFDPRYPHGVQEVKGVHDLLDARVVIHGWFTEPRPMLEGALSFKKIARPMDRLAVSILEGLSRQSVTGTLAIRIKIQESGKIGLTEILSAHLIDPSGNSNSAAVVKNAIQSGLKRVGNFPSARGKTVLTLPFEFK